MNEIEELKKEVVKIKKDFEVEIANLKINYIGSLTIVIAYLFFDKVGGLTFFGYTFSPIWLTTFTALFIITLFFKESLIYGRYITRKILFKSK